VYLEKVCRLKVPSSLSFRRCIILRGHQDKWFKLLSASESQYPVASLNLRIAARFCDGHYWGSADSYGTAVPSNDIVTKPNWIISDGAFSRCSLQGSGKVFC
jgi:hypothetical protein